MLTSDNRTYQLEQISADLAEEVHAVGGVIRRGGQV